MYQMLTGYHPLYQKGDDKPSYIKKLKKYDKLTFPGHVSIQA
jgi:hypothetical protein